MDSRNVLFVVAVITIAIVAFLTLSTSKPTLKVDNTDEISQNGQTSYRYPNVAFKNDCFYNYPTDMTFINNLNSAVHNLTAAYAPYTTQSEISSPSYRGNLSAWENYPVQLRSSYNLPMLSLDNAGVPITVYSSNN
uniref:Uncharacterized protein n=1 Tax=viral metagenome TaxID=1070528 RepID=A0A6C0JVK0_9ZZZZ